MSQSRRPDRRRRSSHARIPPVGGPHELGQNLLIDRRFPAAMAEILRNAPPHPVLELGAGDGAITTALLACGLSVTAVELDPRAAARLRTRLGARARVVEADMLSFEPGPKPHHIIANVPFAITTPLLRRLIVRNHWHTAVLLLQWVVARKRAAVGGTTMFTATWWPWYEFQLGNRVPARAFSPRPSVDGGILIIRRREPPLLPPAERISYQQMVRVAFTGRGQRLPARLRELLNTTAVNRWMSRQALPPKAQPRDLQAPDWIALHRARTLQSQKGRGELE